MTFDELFKHYAGQGFTQPTTPISSVASGIETVAPINYASPIMNTGATDNGNVNTNSTATATSGIGSLGFGNIGLGDIGKAIGFVMNPALSIANMVATNVLGKSPMEMAMNAMGFGDSANGASNGTGSVDTGDLGSEAANDAASASASGGGSSGSSGAASSPGDTGGAGGADGAGGTDGGGADSAGDGGDGYAMGGRINYLQGGIVDILRSYYAK